MRSFFQGTVYQKQRGLFLSCISVAYLDILFSVPLLNINNEGKTIGFSSYIALMPWLKQSCSMDWSLLIFSEEWRKSHLSSTNV